MQNEKDELHRGIWKIADKLRGQTDGWDFKAYVLGMLFYRFISERFSDRVGELSDITGEEYAKLEDEKAERQRERFTSDLGFFIKPSQLFMRVKDSPSQSLNTELNDIFKEIENSANLFPEAKAKFQGLFKDLDSNSDKLGKTVGERVKTLKEIMREIAKIDLHYNKSSIDAFGDAYEFLIAMYAQNAGKSGGEFFTPQEVSQLLVKIALFNTPNAKTIYDPACGSGSLLLQFKKLSRDKYECEFFGQESNQTTYNLARMNMFLHGVDYAKFDIAHGDTLIDPNEGHKKICKDQKGFDLIVSNPPYSLDWGDKRTPTLINDERFRPAGVLAPKDKADYAFILHSLYCLKPSGCAAIVVFPGILYRNKKAEKQIREYLVRNDFIDGIIALPDNLFFGTGIATCIMVLRKNKTDSRVFFIDASARFVKAKNKNRLGEENIEAIFEIYKNRQEIAHTAALIERDVILANECNLSPGSYIEAKDCREKIDIKELNAEIAQIVARQANLRGEIDKIVAELEG